MKQANKLLGDILVLALCATLLSCTVQGSNNHKHEMNHTKADTAKNYIIIKSWEHQREILLTEGDSETEADAKIGKWLASMSSMDRTAGDDRIGVQAPPFKFDGWINSEPLNLEDLKGKVVLVRWFTDTCPFCASSAPALRELHEEYSDQGFALVGVYHPKAGRNDPLDVARVQRVVEARDFKFPVAIDWDWRHGTLKEWWLTGPDRPATSVTFILDKSGVIQFVHPGMEYHDDNGSEKHAMCADDMGRIRAAIESLIAE